ncbi:class I SAM-dependent methyltransferase [Luteibacter sp. SG786]|uniref:class I SAM-dependent methyltransferase n=1 Tax=Luteibacter sp. SG786 TaxID=2587130 RepID=UPI00141FFBDC|nr:class I SAM-dependent methyltransferase [Luteibacter sp. SG786]NII53330.1 putative O-methyltransferase YrrM [Luteibacter sp. SG786]
MAYTPIRRGWVETDNITIRFTFWLVAYFVHRSIHAIAMGGFVVQIAEVLERQRHVEGMLMEVSAAVWCILLEAQHASWQWSGDHARDYLEIGTFKGKAASILASFTAEYGNRLAIVDPEVRPETRSLLDSITSTVSYMEMRSEFLAQGDFLRANLRNLAWAHIDGMHSFAAVVSDVSLCEQMLGDYGIICIDDFHTDLYPQIPAAVYKYLYTTPTDLCVFLVGFNKAYLCRNVAFRYFSEFVGKNIHWSLKELGHLVSLVKTGRHSQFDAHAIAPFQGEHTFGAYVGQ